MSIWGGTAAAGIIGDMISSRGASSANRLSAQMQTENMDLQQDEFFDAQNYNRSMTTEAQNFAKQQQNSAQSFNAAEQTNQQQFNNAEMLQTENYNTQMSDTAMQRRMADLKASGLNPLLAIGAGGASSPTAMPASSSAASVGASTAGALSSPGPGSAGNASIGNPSAAWGNLGNQVGNIAASAANVKSMFAQANLADAQARNVDAQTDQKMPADIENIKAQTGLTTSQAANAQATLQKIGYETETAHNQQNITGAQVLSSRIQAQVDALDLDTKTAVQKALITIQNDNAKAADYGLPQLQNMSEIQQSTFGKIVNYLNTALQPVGTAMGAAKGTLMLPHTTQHTDQ